MPEIKQERYEDSLVYRVRHSSAHIMAQAVLEKFPTAKIAIGPAIEEGYYYDFVHFPVDVPGFVRHIKGAGANLVRLGTLMGDFAASPFL